MKKYLINYKLIVLFLMIGMLISFISQCGEQTKTFIPGGKYITSGYKAAKKLRAAYKAYNKEFLPLEEYEIGRRVAASILQEETLYGNGSSPLEEYITNIGNTLAMGSNRPETFQGYRFIVLRSPLTNVLALPSGYIFITTGLIQLASNEEELAGAIAHGVSHVVLFHPTKSISSARRTEIVLDLVKYGASEAAGKDKLLKGLTKSFGGVLKDIGKETLKDYNRQWKKEADLMAVQLMINAGYDPRGLSSMLRKLKPGRGVHGNPSVRADNVDIKIATYNGKIPKTLRYRTKRFNRFVPNRTRRIHPLQRRNP
ncbi:MAG: hypothetical protein IEMM0008_1100 [bacterium]|nr:MAG: hypothetical protein IEMM0008_1100 [bacterium]